MRAVTDKIHMKTSINSTYIVEETSRTKRKSLPRKSP